MKKKIIILSSSILTILIIIAIVLGVLFFPRSLSDYMNVSFEDIDSIYIETGYDEPQKYVLTDSKKEDFYQKIKNITIVPTYSNIKAISTLKFVIETKNQTFSFCDFYYFTNEKVGRNEFNIRNIEEYQSLFTLFANFDLKKYYDSL